MIHRKQQKYFNNGEWKHLPLTRHLYGPPSETVMEQLRKSFAFALQLLFIVNQKWWQYITHCHTRSAVAGHHFTLTYGLLLISWPEMLFQHINDTGFVLLVYFTPGLVNCLSKCNHLFPRGVRFITRDPPPNTLKMRHKRFLRVTGNLRQIRSHLSLKDLKRVADVFYTLSGEL